MYRPFVLGLSNLWPLVTVRAGDIILIFRVLFFVTMVCGQLFGATVVSAGQVTISLRDGSFSMTGELLAYDSEFYHLSSDAYGEMRMATKTTVCAGEDCPDLSEIIPVIRMSVAPTVGELLIPALIENFASSRGMRLRATASDNGAVNIRLSQTGAGKEVIDFVLTLRTAAQAFEDLQTGRADIIVARRGPTKTEFDAIEAPDDVELWSKVVGWENLRLYTGLENPTEALTVNQLLKMTTKAKALWPDQKGVGVDIQGDADTVTAMFQQLDQPTPDVLDAVALAPSPGALMVTPNLSLPHKHVQVAASCGTAVVLDDLAPGAHPLQAPVSIFHLNTRMTPATKKFLTYAVSLPAQRIVARSGYISRTPVETQLDSNQSYLFHAILNSDNDVSLGDFRKAVRSLKDYGRLSLTFRFKEGTRDLDEVSESNLQFLSDLLQQGRYVEREVLFAGFSDNVGDPKFNLSLSKSRATDVLNAIRARMGEKAPPKSQFKATGFGEVLPLACNDTDWGQHQNRRVEIWLR